MHTITDPAMADVCPVCDEPDYKWTAEGCSCWLCNVCMTTNPKGDKWCRSCGTYDARGWHLA